MPEKWIIDGVKCEVFENHRIDASAAPAGFPYRYSSRHGDDGGTPLTLEEGVTVNHWGTIFSETPFVLTNGFYEIKEIVSVDHLGNEVCLFDVNDPFFTEENDEEVDSPTGLNLLEIEEKIKSGELVECPNCNGYGSSLKEEPPRCTQCKGSGVITPKGD